MKETRSSESSGATFPEGPVDIFMLLFRVEDKSRKTTEYSIQGS
jgi:hypothetical protein